MIVDSVRVRPLSLQSKTLAVLAYIADAGAPVPRAELARTLFTETDDPRRALRWHLAQLKGALPPDVRGAVRVEGGDVAFSLETDVQRFRRDAERCLRTFDPDLADATLALYRGDFLSGVAAVASPEFDTWLLIREESLRTLFRRLALAFGAWCVDTAHADRALEPLSRLVTLDPYVEDGHAFFIRSLLAVGDTARARAAYERYDRVVQGELQSEPRQDIRALLETPTSSVHVLPRDGFAALSDVTLHFVEWPGGEPPVLCLHGSVVSGYVFSALARHLAPDARVVAPSRRGNGFSDKPRTGYTAARHVSDFLELMAALGIERPVIIGHSTGGGLAVLLAERCDARGLVLLDGVVGTSDVVRDRFDAAAIVLDEARKPIFDVPTYMAAMRRRRQPSSTDAERLLERIERYQLVRMPDGSYRQNVNAPGVAETWNSIVESDTIGALRRLSCPTLIVWATRPWLLPGEPYFSEAIVRAQLDNARDSELVVAGTSDHASLVRDPEPLVVNAVQAFVRRVGPLLRVPSRLPRAAPARV